MAIKFINREKELDWLNEQYKKAEEEAQLLILYGKRRVGKTELVRRFIDGKEHVYYLANRTTTQAQLQDATGVFSSKFGDKHISSAQFANWRAFFDYVGKRVKQSTKRIILVFDEFPFLVESNLGISSFFQYAWDMWFKDTKAIMILMGSSISMMYKHALVRSAPLYGRRTGQWLLEPFNYEQTKNFYPNQKFEHTFPLYAVSGGIPAYARVFDGSKTLEQNIKDNVFPEGSFLSVEPELLLADEFTDPRSYLTILKAIGLGRTRFSQILQDTGLPTTALPGYLKTLTNLRLVKKEVPVTEKMPEKSKKGNYSLADAFLRFYFSFVFPYNSLIKSGNYKALFEQHGELLISLVAKSYEDATIEFIEKAIQQRMLPAFEQLGRWWDRNTEIDLVGLNKTENSILFVETKWNKKPLGRGVLQELKQKSQKVKWGGKGRKEYFALVAKGGFSEELVKEAQKENVVLIQEDRVVNKKTQKTL